MEVEEPLPSSSEMLRKGSVPVGTGGRGEMGLKRPGWSDGTD